MFNEEELKSYGEIFNQLGIDSEEEQRKVLEFFYSVGIIVLNQGK